jgi:hypothetical protein
VLVREIERAGVATSSISLVREHSEQVKPPRALFVPFPFGYPLGQANNPELQLRVLRAALALLERPAGPILEDFPDESGPDGDINLPQAASVPSMASADDPAFEVTKLRPYYEQWVATHDGRTHVGLTGVDQRRFRGLVRLLEAYASGDDSADAPERAPDVSLPQFLRWAADDMRSFYFEARLNQKPDGDFRDINAWFWGETAMANLLRKVRDRMKAAGDPALDAIAFGIAR